MNLSDPTEPNKEVVVERKIEVDERVESKASPSFRLLSSKAPVAPIGVGASAVPMAAVPEIGKSKTNQVAYQGVDARNTHG